MRIIVRFIATLLLLRTNALAAVHYVDVHSSKATPPYLSWSTAASDIQDAVDAAEAGDEIVVTNGIYVTGGRSVTLQSTPNLNSPITWSTNSPGPVVIDGKNVVTTSVVGPQQFYRLVQYQGINQ